MKKMIGLIGLIWLILMLPMVGASIGILISSQDYNVDLAKGQTYYFSYRLYNQGSEPGIYFLRLSVKGDEKVDVNKLFDYNFSENHFLLQPTENKPIMLTVVPKVDEGEYVISVVGERELDTEDLNNTGAFIRVTAEKELIVRFSSISESEEVMEKPGWKIGEERKEEENKEEQKPTLAEQFLAEAQENPTITMGAIFVGLVFIILLIGIARR